MDVYPPDPRVDRLRDDLLEAIHSEETRRHTGVLIESIRTDVRAVAEGVMAVDEKLERFRVEVRDEFGRVDRRLLRLETRVSAFENR